MGKNIIAVEWRSSRTTIGIVAVADPDGGWRGYMASTSGTNEKADAEMVADWGGYLNEREARAFFPQLDNMPYLEHE